MFVTTSQQPILTFKAFYFNFYMFFSIIEATKVIGAKTKSNISSLPCSIKIHIQHKQLPYVTRPSIVGHFCT